MPGSSRASSTGFRSTASFSFFTGTHSILPISAMCVTAKNLSRSGASCLTQPARPLTRDGILGAAIEFGDEHGLTALTMRRLTEGVRVPPHDPIGHADGWQAFLQHVAHAVRSIAVDHPNLSPMVATRPPAAPWSRPPLRSLALGRTSARG